MDSKAKLILHPVRMKIVQTLIGGKELNVGQMAERLTNVPQATLYRHLNKLLDAGIIKVIKENQIRGTVEKIYALADHQVASKEEMENLSKDEQLHLFLTFMTYLLGQYEQYLNQDEFDLYRDGVLFREAIVYLSDEEYNEFLTGLTKLMKNIMGNEPSKDRSERHIATIVIPEAKH